jgi:hypothetical protein
MQNNKNKLHADKTIEGKNATTYNIPNKELNMTEKIKVHSMHDSFLVQSNLLLDSLTYTESSHNIPNRMMHFSTDYH